MMSDAYKLSSDGQDIVGCEKGGSAMRTSFMSEYHVQDSVCSVRLWGGNIGLSWGR